MANTQYIGARYVPMFYTNPDTGTNDWHANVVYDPLTIVTDLTQSYTSKIPVPANIGRPSENPTYWILTGIYNAQVEQYRQDVVRIEGEFDELKNDIEDEMVDFRGVVDKRNYKFEGSKIIGHAGVAGYATANTMYGVNLALELEADGVEIDCQITSDHIPVCHHNPVVDGNTLRETPWSTVKDIVVATQGQHHVAQTIPKLATVANAVKMAGKTLLVEFKWEAEGHMIQSDLAYVKECLDNVGISDVVFISWVAEPLTMYKQIDPSARCIWLLGDPTPVSNANIDACKALGFWGVGLPASTDASFMQYAHSVGLKIDAFTLNAWDVNTNKCFANGVDYITTNSILTCGCTLAKDSMDYVASAPSVQGIPMINKFSSKVNDPAFPYFVATVSRFDETGKGGIARYYGGVSNNRANSLPLSVKPGDVIKLNPNSVYDMSIEVLNTYLSTWIANSGWLSGDYTIPASGYHAVLIYRKKDDTALDLWDLAPARSLFGGIVRS